ncbi:MAG TPA: DUF4097 family beta strand repeat-containing protein [Methylomirabilota bacterium]|nr:DUF4097 family beta strand repeat-containing protein [Methylomirabilota bacterium]
MRYRSLVLAAVPLFLAFAAFAKSAADGEFKRTLAAPPNTAVSISTGAGYIHVSETSGDQISVTGHVYVSRSYHGDADARLREILANPPISQENGRILIGPHHSESYRDIAFDFDVVLPKSVSLAAATGAGEIRVAGIPSVSSISSGAGNVDLEGVSSGLKISTGAGNILAKGTPAADWTVHSGAGNVTLEFGSNAKFNLNASSGSGGIHVEMPILMQQTDFGNFHVRGQINGGGPEVRISTGSGRIHIR